MATVVLDRISNAFWLLPNGDQLLSWWQTFQLIEAKIGGVIEFPPALTAGLAPPNFTTIRLFLNAFDPSIEYQDLGYLFVVKIANDHSSRAAVFDFLYDYACTTQIKIACFNHGISLEPSQLDIIGFMTLCAHNWRKRHSNSFILHLDTTKGRHDEIANNASYEAYFVYLVPPLLHFKTTSLTDLYQPNSPWPFPQFWSSRPEQPLVAALERHPCSLITTSDDCEVVHLFEFLAKYYPSCHILITPPRLRWVNWLSLAKENIVPLDEEAIKGLQPFDFTAVETALTQWTEINHKPVLYHNARYIFFIFLPHNASERSAIIKLLNPFQNNSLVLNQNEHGIALEPSTSPTFELFITQWLQCYHQPNARLFYLFHADYSPLATVVQQKGGQVIQLTKPPEANQTSPNLLVEISNFVSDQSIR